MKNILRLSGCCLGVSILVVMVVAECGFGQEPGADGATIKVFLGKSRIVKTPWPVARVSITLPKIADVQVLTPRQVLVLGKSTGSTDLIMWSKTEQVRQLRVEVVADVKQLNAEIARLFPDCRLEITTSGETLVVTGMLAKSQQAVQLREFLTASGLKYVDMSSVGGVQQVQLQVRLAEVSRSAIRALGLNAFQTGEDIFYGQMLGSAGGGPINPISIGPPSGASAARRRIPFVFSSDTAVSSSVTLFAGFPRIGLELFLQALAENQYMRILAEPTLVALSGEEASFLAGGEFPIPVVQGGAEGGTSISVEYREFGVRLRFRPTVLGDGSIRLYVAPEVSELSDIGAVEIAGFRVPSVLTRKAETTLEMKSGQTFGMAGLLTRTNSSRVSRVPGLGDLPIIGALFRSVRYTDSETELVVLVTATLVEPMAISAGRLPVPGIMHTPPNDWELYALGKIEGQAPTRISPADAAWLQQMGLDRLKGPGAWMTYESGASRSHATVRPELTVTDVAPDTRPAVETQPHDE